jgi:cell division protein FtsW
MTIAQFLKPKGDKVMWFIILILSLWGLLAVYSSVSWLAYKNKSSTFFYLFQHAFFIFSAYKTILFI